MLVVSFVSVSSLVVQASSNPARQAVGCLVLAASLVSSVGDMQ